MQLFIGVFVLAAGYWAYYYDFPVEKKKNK